MRKFKNHNKPVQCPDCKEMLRWFEVDNDGRCPICGAIVDVDQHEQPTLFQRELQTFIK